MTTWYGGNGWGWCSMVGNIPAMVLLWVAVFTAIVLAFYLASRRPSEPPVPAGRADFTRAEGVVTTRHVPGEIDNDEFFRRLM
jgi:uncharacterized membrane protein